MFDQLWISKIINSLISCCFIEGYVTDGPFQTIVEANVINDVDAQRENHVLTITFSGFKVFIKWLSMTNRWESFDPSIFCIEYAKKTIDSKIKVSMKYIGNQPQFLRGSCTGSICLAKKLNALGQQLLHVSIGQKQQWPQLTMVARVACINLSWKQYLSILL